MLFKAKFKEFTTDNRNGKTYAVFTLEPTDIRLKVNENADKNDYIHAKTISLDAFKTDEGKSLVYPRLPRLQ